MTEAPKPISFELIRAKRRSLSIAVTAQGCVVVRAPLRMSRRDIDALVQGKRAWIEEKQAAAARRAALYPQREAAAGEELLYLGQPLLLVFSDAVKRPELMEHTLALPRAWQAQADAAVRAWYRLAALAHLRERVAHFSRAYGIPYAFVGVTSARRRWGSCNAGGRLNFAWRLILCPPDVVDYVVVHELCHVRELNHSAAFWAHVEAILPDYRRRLAWLKEHNGILNLF